MRLPQLSAWAALALLVAVHPSHAAAPVPLVMGTSRDGSLHELQRKVDHFLGPGRVDVRRDFVGARPGDPDPWFWVNPGHVISLQVVDRKSPNFVIGWYAEAPACPALDGEQDGVVLERWRTTDMPAPLRLPRSVERFGFYVVDSHPTEGGEAVTLWTNRTFNTPGPDGIGAEHAPFDGDVQMLVYDVSRWLGPRSWLVACEVSDSGRRVGHGEDETDNDYSDVLFTVSGVGVTPTLPSSFGRVKAMFR